MKYAMKYAMTCNNSMRITGMTCLWHVFFWNVEILRANCGAVELLRLFYAHESQGITRNPKESNESTVKSQQINIQFLKCQWHERTWKNHEGITGITGITAQLAEYGWIWLNELSCFLTGWMNMAEHGWTWLNDWLNAWIKDDGRSQSINECVTEWGN